MEISQPIEPVVTHAQPTQNFMSQLYFLHKP